MIGRAIVNKHRAYTFHRPSALWLAQIMVDLSFAAVQIFVFSVMVYFMCHLVRDAGAFFTFYLVIVCGYLVMTLFFRVIGTVTPDCKFLLDLVMIWGLTDHPSRLRDQICGLHHHTPGAYFGLPYTVSEWPEVVSLDLLDEWTGLRLLRSYDE